MLNAPQRAVGFPFPALYRFQTNYLTGRGHYKRNKATNKSHIKDSGKRMQEASNEAVKTALDELLNTIPAKLVGASNAVIEQIMGEVKLFFEQNTSKGLRNKTRKVKSNSKIRLQKDLLSNINDLTKSWESNDQAQIQYNMKNPRMSSLMMIIYLTWRNFRKELITKKTTKLVAALKMTSHP